MGLEDTIKRATENLTGYMDNGPGYWPGASYFTLASLTEDGECDGGGADVCRDCVSKVATEALIVMEEWHFEHKRYHWSDMVKSPPSAVVTCGLAPAYEITGSTDSHAAAYDGEPTWCAECGSEIE